MSNPIEDAKETVEDAVEEVPEPVVTPDPEPEPEPEPETHDSDRPEWVDEIIERLDSITVASPVTEPTEEVLDETPVGKPWTHRWFGK